jgi:hypothetical protein
LYRNGAVGFIDWLDDLMSELQKVWRRRLLFSGNASASVEVEEQQDRGNDNAKPTENVQLTRRPNCHLRDSVTERRKQKWLSLHKHHDAGNEKQRRDHQ